MFSRQWLAGVCIACAVVLCHCVKLSNVHLHCQKFRILWLGKSWDIWRWKPSVTGHQERGTLRFIKVELLVGWGTGAAGMCVLLCVSWTREVINEHTSVDGPNLGRHVVVAFIRYRRRQILLGYVLITTVTKCWRCRFIGTRVALDVFRSALLPPRPHRSVKVNSQLGEINHLILSNEAVVTVDGRWLIGFSAMISVDLACVSKLPVLRNRISFCNMCGHCVIFGTITGDEY